MNSVRDGPERSFFIEKNKKTRYRKMYIDVKTIITAASLITAIGVIFGAVFGVYRWYLKQNKQDAEIKKIKEEQCLLTYGIMACLDGLQQLGANHTVPETRSRIEKHINKQAHDWAE